MDNPRYSVLVLSICVPLATGTCCFVLLGLLALRHHQQYRDEMIALRREANERAERFARTYGYNTFATPVRFTSPSWSRDLPGSRSSAPRSFVNTKSVRAGKVLHHRSVSLPVNKLDISDIDEEHHCTQIPPRPKLNRARRSSDPTTLSNDIDLNSDGLSPSKHVGQ